MKFIVFCCKRVLLRVNHLLEFAALQPIWHTVEIYRTIQAKPPPQRSYWPFVLSCVLEPVMFAILYAPLVSVILYHIYW